MSNVFEPIKANDISDNTFKLIGKDWMLITSGTLDSYNTMTASWGGLGVLWNKNVCFIFVRPSRYTYEFIEKNETFSLCFFSEEYREILNTCGKKSGRDIDKAKETGLLAFKGENNTVCFEQARMIIECRKIYYQDIIPANFLDAGIEKNYMNKDYHRMYVGEILSASIRK